MLNHKLLGSVSSLPQDDNFENVTLLLSGDGTNGAQNNTFLDSSTNNFTITRNGNTTQGSFSPYGTLWSNYFGSGNYISVASNAAFGFGNVFTVEAWVYITDALSNGNAQYVTDFRTGSTNNYAFGVINSSGNLKAYGYVGSGNVDIIANTTLSLNTWYHIAWVNTGSTLTIYLNGTSDKTQATSYSQGTTGFIIGARYTGATEYVRGNISNLRIDNTALYTTTFTPSTTPLVAVSGTKLLTCQSNRFVDNSSTAATFTITGSPSVQRFSPFNPTEPYSTSVIGGSGYFDGSGDYLSVADNAALQMGSGDFTVEAWVYSTATNAGASIIDKWKSGSFTDSGFLLAMDGSGRLRGIYASGGSEFIIDSSSTLPRDSWTHVAIVRSGSTFYLYQNGVSVNSRSISGSVNNGLALGIGARAADSGTQPWLGYISQARIVKGTAVYSGSTYTVPTAPLTAITNTSLLTNFTNAGIPDLAMMNDLETVGNAQVSTSVKKYGTGSLAFDGSGDGLNAADSPQFDFGSGDFTVEMWIYANSLSGEQFILGQHNYSSYYAPFRFEFNGTTLVALMSTTGSSWSLRLEAGTALSTSTWYHIALVRNGTSFKIYVNGSQYDSGTLSGALYNSTDIMRVGWGAIGAGDFAFNGYIDDLRITKGLARYTTTFTPPTSALPTY